MAYASKLAKSLVRRTFPKLTRVKGHDLVPPIPQGSLYVPVPNELVRILLKAAEIALENELTSYAALLPLSDDQVFFRQWPGEHYRLLYGLTKVMKPALTVEVGTYRGASALAMADYSKRLVTFDIIPIGEMPGAIQGGLADRDNVEQRIGDLANDSYFLEQADLFRNADLVVIDGPKDGRFENVVIPRVLRTMKPGAVLVLDDVRFRNMQTLWAGLSQPRIDIGSLGHWSGTGVVLA